MGMGIGDRWNIICGIDRNGSQLGGVNVWVLGLFRNSFPHSQNALGKGCGNRGMGIGERRNSFTVYTPLQEERRQ
jgi:hypothetical protein